MIIIMVNFEINWTHVIAFFIWIYFVCKPQYCFLQSLYSLIQHSVFRRWWRWKTNSHNSIGLLVLLTIFNYVSHWHICFGWALLPPISWKINLSTQIQRTNQMNICFSIFLGSGENGKQKPFENTHESIEWK